MTKVIPLTQGQVALIDDWNYERVSQIKWWAEKDSRTGKFYARGWINGQMVELHRFILNAPDGIEVDHRDRNRLNCHESNLRQATHIENAQNHSLRRDNASGYRGVSVDTATGRFKAIIKSDGVAYFIGRFDKADDAARACDVVIGERHGEFAVFNFPDEWRWDATEAKWHKVE